MADNVAITAGSGTSIAADDVASVYYQRVKLDGGGDGATVPILSGGGVEASAIRVTIASDSTGVVSVDDNGASLTVDNAALSVTGGGVEASALRVTLASDSTGVVSVDDNGASLTVDNTDITTLAGVVTSARAAVNPIVGQAGIAAGAGAVGVTVPRVTLASDDPGVALLTTIDSDTSTLAVVGNGTAATAQRVTLANDSTGIVALTTSSAAIGKLAANSGVDIGDVDVTSISTGDNVIGRMKITDGTLVASVRDTGTSDSLNVAIVDGSGNQITAFGGTGGTSSSDDAAFTLGGASSITVAGGIYIPGKDAVDSGDAGGLAMTQYRALHAHLVDAAGDAVSVGGGTQYAQGTAGTATDQLTMAGAVRKDTPAVDAGVADGDRVVLSTDSTGKLHVNVGNTVTVGSHAVTNAGTFAVQVDGAALTSLQLIDDAISGSEMQVDVVAALPAGTNNIGDVDVLSIVPGTGATNLGKAIDTAAGATDTGVGALAVRDDALGALTPIEGDWVSLRTDANGALWTHDDVLEAALSGSELQVDVVAALPAGTNNIGDVDVLSIAAGDNNIGNVDIVTVPADPFGANADAASATGSISAKLRFIAATGIPVTALPASTNTLEVVGDVAHDSAVGGNPVLIGTEARDTLGTVVASGDVVRVAASRYGASLTSAFPPSHVSSNGTPITATTTTVIAAPSAGNHLRIVRIFFSNGGSTASWVSVRDGAAGTRHYSAYLVQGAMVSLNLNSSGPLDLTTATRLDIYMSAAGSVEYEIDYFTVAD